MNQEIRIPLPPVSDFPYLSEFFLRHFGKIHLPNLSQAELKACQSYYLQQKTAPSGTSELAFLNALAAKKRLDPSALLLSEMQTDDPFLAETFADLMAKRAAVSPDYKTPCSLAEIPRIAQEYLAARAENKEAFRGLTVCSAPRSALTLSSQKITPTLVCGDPSTGFSGGNRASHALCYSAPLAENDKIYAFLESTDPNGRFEETVLRFVASPAVQSHAKRICPLGEGGVFAALAGLGMGVEADLVRLYGESTSATRLLDKESGILLVAKESEAAAFLMEALDMGLRPRLLGELRKDALLILRESADAALRLSLHFMNTFLFSRAYRAESDPPAPTISSLKAFEPCTRRIGEEKYFAASVRTDASRHASLYAALHALAACVARGMDPRDVRIAERFSLSLSDTSPTAIGAQLALLLGSYRAVTEFELSSLDCSILTAEDEQGFSLCAIGREPEAPTPQKLVSQCSGIYLLEPLYDENGNPDFKDVKKMFEYVGKLKRDGKILSAHAVVGDVLPALEKMGKNSLVEWVADSSFRAAAGSILIETKDSIQGILLARTHKPDIPETAPETLE